MDLFGRENKSYPLIAVFMKLKELWTGTQRQFRKECKTELPGGINHDSEIILDGHLKTVVNGQCKYGVCGDVICAYTGHEI